MSRRPLDLILVIFFAVNLLVVTYMIDLEQIVIADPSSYHQPWWPPAPVVDLVHWYGRTYDPLLMARPAFWRMTIWIDVVGFGPFYACAIYALVRRRNWIRVPALVWSGLMLANVLIILMEERYGIHAAPSFGRVLAANAVWLVMPFVVMFRMRRDPFPVDLHPFADEPAEVVA